MSYVTEHLFSPPEGNFPPCRNLSPSIHCNLPTMSDFFQSHGNIFSSFPLVSAVIFQPCRTFSNHTGICRLPSAVIFRPCRTFSNHMGIFLVVSPFYPPESSNHTKIFRSLFPSSHRTFSDHTGIFPLRTAGLYLPFSRSTEGNYKERFNKKIKIIILNKLFKYTDI